MKNTPELLFEFLRDVIYAPNRASLNIESLDEPYQMVGKGLVLLADVLAEERAFAKALARGDLSAAPPSRKNELIGPLKELHSNLKHLTWKSQRVTEGDFSQRIDFLGELSESFNTMAEQLHTRERVLQEEIESGRKKTQALEESNDLLSSITANIPQTLLVLEIGTDEILFKNEAAGASLLGNEALMNELITLARNTSERANDGCEIVIDTSHEEKRYYQVRVYYLQWSGRNACAFLVDDVSSNKAREQELETFAFRDSLTGLFNRFYGMRVLNQMVDEKRLFTMCFIDLDNLKFINDTFGHKEGDLYITSVAKLLGQLPDEAVACRIGGDEFMVLFLGYNEAMSEQCAMDLRNTLKAEYLAAGKEYPVNISYGLKAAIPEEELTASTILSIADERMYEQKRQNKRART